MSFMLNVVQLKLFVSSR